MTANVQPGQSEESVGVMSEESADAGGVSRRMLLRLGAAGGAGAALVTAQGLGGPFLAQRGLLAADGAFAATSTALGDKLFYIEAFPTSPLILSPFSDALPIPKAVAPVPKSEYSAWANPPGPGTRPAELAGQPAASDLAEPDRLSGPDRLQDRPSG